METHRPRRASLVLHLLPLHIDAQDALELCSPLFSQRSGEPLGVAIVLYVLQISLTPWNHHVDGMLTLVVKIFVALGDDNPQVSK